MNKLFQRESYSFPFRLTILQYEVFKMFDLSKKFFKPGLFSGFFHCFKL